MRILWTAMTTQSVVRRADTHKRGVSRQGSHRPDSDSSSINFRQVVSQTGVRERGELVRAANRSEVS